MPAASIAIGSLLAALGAGIKRRQGINNAHQRADARNDVLSDTFARNDPLAADSRNQFTNRVADFGGIQAGGGDFRNSLLESATDVGPSEVLAGSAPEAVRSEIAASMLRAVQSGKEQARSLAKIGAPGDALFKQGVANQGLSRNLGVNTNLANGNFGILPARQDIAEMQVPPPGPIGDIMMGVGNAIGSYGGRR